MLTARNLSVMRAGAPILQGVSFSLSRGELLAVVGRNGSGKSTLLAAIASAPYLGELLLDGREARTLSPRERARLVSLMPQLLPRPHASVQTLLAMGRTPYLPLSGKLSDADREAISRAECLAELSPLLTRSLSVLSGGELRRAYLGMALAQATPLLLLDEATAYLDGVSEGALLSLAERLAHREGLAVAAVLHDLGDAVSIADRILLLDGGEARFFGTPAELLSRDLPETLLGLRRYTAVDERGTPRIFFKGTAL